MPLSGDYKPGTAAWARKQADLYESSMTVPTRSWRQWEARRSTRSGTTNLKQRPHVELQDGPTKRDYLAREVSGDEKAVWWGRAVETWPDYAKYQTRTDRQIPVFVLEAIE